MSAIKLGDIITEKPQHPRDAIHVAVIAMVAGQRLHAGQHVRVSQEDGRAYGSNNPHGVVDPFLQAYVAAGEVFWMLLAPGAVTNTRHTWSHAEFPDEDGREIDYDSWCGESGC